MESIEVFNELKVKIDSIVYEDDLKSVDVDERITVGWRSALAAPPSNSSEITKRELKYLSDISSSLTIKKKNLIRLVDKDPFDLFVPILKKNQLKFNKENLDKVWNIASDVITNLKIKFNRPRPEQLAPAYGLKINVTQTDTHQTPAYPSGHTSYAAFCAYLLADTYPKHSSSFFAQVGVAGYARCIQGVHYPSDNEAAMTISGVLWEDLKYQLFPELYPTYGELDV